MTSRRRTWAGMSNRDKAKAVIAQQRHQAEQSLTPIPARITTALDLRGLDGDDVDRALGVWESPDGEWEPGTAVDRWEDGTLVPTEAHIRALAKLTDFPVAYFHRPYRDGEVPTYTRICGKDGGLVTSWVDERGVLHRLDGYHEIPGREPTSNVIPFPGAPEAAAAIRPTAAPQPPHGRPDANRRHPPHPRPNPNRTDPTGQQKTRTPPGSASSAGYQPTRRTDAT